MTTKFILVAVPDTNWIPAPLYRSFADHFGNCPNVEVKSDSILACKANAIVSPANSYGWMGGGIDLLYRNEFGFDIQHKVQQAYLARYPDTGELPVGEAVTVSTGSPLIPFLISAPTMRTPGPVNHTQNAYLAFKAAIDQAIKQGFQTVLCPGLATGYGRMTPDQAAAQMRKAYDEVMGAQQ